MKKYYTDVFYNTVFRCNEDYSEPELYDHLQGMYKPYTPIKGEYNIIAKIVCTGDYENINEKIAEEIIERRKKEFKK